VQSRAQRKTEKASAQFGALLAHKIIAELETKLKVFLDQ
jgi:hypothetical protein